MVRSLTPFTPSLLQRKPNVPVPNTASVPQKPKPQTAQTAPTRGSLFASVQPTARPVSMLAGAQADKSAPGHSAPALAAQPMPGSAPPVSSDKHTGTSSRLFCPAKAMGPAQRKHLAVNALAGVPVSRIAQENEVSRKFVYQQANAAAKALDEVFAPTTPDDKVLFQIQITKAWLQQMVLGLTLHCHSSFRGVIALFRDMLNTSISLGTIHNILAAAVAKARVHNAQQNLGQVRIGAHDEIFQNQQPVLVGCDVASTYCYLLSQEEHRDADTWAVRLLDLQAQSFAPEATIADFGSGLRAGQKEAMDDVPCRGDVFHAEAELHKVATYLDNRAYDAIATRSKLDQKKAQEQRHGRPIRALGQKLRHAGTEETQAVNLADDFRCLADWLQQDILAVNALSQSQRADLYDFVVAELCAREHLCPHRLRPVRTLLQNQRAGLLAFSGQLDQDLADLAAKFQVATAVVRQLLQVQTMKSTDPTRWQQEAVLRQQLGERFHLLVEDLDEVVRHTVRASSVVENLNSRLRSYFFLRRHLGADYLALLQFFLNHRRFPRSKHPDRVNKSPAELLTGEAHPHWLEMLGYNPFSRN